MSEKIDVHDLTEEQVRFISELVEFFRQKGRHPEQGNDKEGIGFEEWPLEVKGNLRRSEIYDHL